MPGLGLHALIPYFSTPATSAATSVSLQGTVPGASFFALTTFAAAFAFATILAAVLRLL